MPVNHHTECTYFIVLCYSFNVEIALTDFFIHWEPSHPVKVFFMLLQSSDRLALVLISSANVVFSDVDIEVKLKRRLLKRRELDVKEKSMSIDSWIFRGPWFLPLFQNWKALNLCRCLAAIIGWVIVSLRPSTDLLQKNLRRLEYNGEFNRSQHRLGIWLLFYLSYL